MECGGTLGCGRTRRYSNVHASVENCQNGPTAGDRTRGPILALPEKTSAMSHPTTASSEDNGHHGRRGISQDAIRIVQDWIDHPSWDTQEDTSESKDEDIQRCVDLFREDAAERCTESANRPIPASFSAQVETDESIVEASADRFAFERLLGVGAFGVVLAVYDKILARRVALKILRPSLGNARTLERRFLREVQVAASLDHTGIVRVFETGRIGSHPYIMTALIDGPNLAIHLKDRGGIIRACDAAELIAHVAEALQFAHERGVLHRDLKPGNILLEPDTNKGDTQAYMPRLTDFGLAKRVNDPMDEKANLSDGCQMLGTLRYCSPEQASGRLKDVGTASDIYSLGAILHQALTGKTPHEGSSNAELLTNILQNPVPSLRRLDSAISKDIDNIVLKCLSREPHDRYATAVELAADLKRFLRGEPVVARKASVVRRLRYWVWENPAIAGMATLTLAVILGALIVMSVLYVRERQAVDLALKAINESYVRVAEDVLIDVPNSAEKRYQLHLMALDAHKKLAEGFGYDARSRHRLSVAYSYAGTAAGRLARRQESRQYREACIDLLQRLLKEDPDNERYQYDLFFNRNNIANAMHDAADDPRDRIAMKELVHESILKLLKLAPKNRDYLDASASAKMSLAAEYVRTDKARAPQMFREACEISDRLWAENPKDLVFVKYALTARAHLADLLRNNGDLKESERLCLEAVAILQSITNPDRTRPWFEEIEREPIRSLAELRFSQGNWAEAVPLLRRCAEISNTQSTLHPENDGYLHMQCQFAIELLRAERHLGNVPNSEARLAEIERLLTECERFPGLGVSYVQAMRSYLSDTSANPMKIGR